MKQYSFFVESWDINDPTEKSVFTRHSQGKIIRLILQKCPDAKTFRIEMSKRNSGNYLAMECDPNWTRGQYLAFLKNRVVKYNSTVKIVLSILIGQAAMATVLYGLTSLLDTPSLEQKRKEASNALAKAYSERDKLIATGASQDQIDNLMNDPKLTQQAIELKSLYDRKKRQMTDNTLRSLIIGGSSGYFGVGSIWDKIDKDTIK